MGEISRLATYFPVSMYRIDEFRISRESPSAHPVISRINARPYNDGTMYVRAYNMRIPCCPMPHHRASELVFRLLIAHYLLSVTKITPLTFSLFQPSIAAAAAAAASAATAVVVVVAAACTCTRDAGARACGRAFPDTHISSYIGKRPVYFDDVPMEL